jgi:hypothetical protein
VRTITSEDGYSMMEVLISAALGTIVLAGVFDVYVSSTKNLLNQSNAIQVQADTKAAMDYMVRELRMAVTAYTPLTITPPLTGSTITFVRGEDSGYSSGGNTATTLWDTSKAWTAHKFQQTSAGSYSVWIKTGPSSGTLRTIQDNTSTTLTVTPGWTAPYPDNTSLYFIVRTKAFTLLPDKTLRYNINGGNYYLLAQNVTALSFSQDSSNPPNKGCSATNICITLTAQSKDPDPNTKQYLTYTLTDTARSRN